MPKKRSDGRMQRKFRYEGKAYFVYGRTAAELNEKQLAKIEQLKKNIARREQPTLDEYYEKWTAGRVNVKSTTIATQKTIYRLCANIIIDDAGKRLGDMRLDKIRPDDLRAVQSVLSETHRAKGVNQYMAHLSHVFNGAIDDELIDKNPCRPVKSLAVKDTPARETIHRALTVKETTAFFNTARERNSFYYGIFRFALATGMRIGEIGALKNSDIYGGAIHIERTLTNSEDGRVIGYDTKTATSRREIPLNDNIRDIIAYQRKINRILDGGTEQIDGLIFQSERRGVLCNAPVNAEIERICDEIGIERFTMHAFRDTFATRMIEAGVNPKTVQTLLGHARYAITMDLYAHTMDDTMREAMKETERLLQAI